MANNLSIKTQGKRGGNPTYKENIGYSNNFLGHPEDSILIDSYEGQGNSYKKRETLLIEIRHNGNLLFSGDKYELYEILKNHSNKE